MNRLYLDLETHYIPPYYRLVITKNKSKIYSDSYYNKGKPLSVYYSKDGYPKVKMNNKGTLVHQVVAKMCIGRRPNGKVINHKDGIKTNNHPSNLEYVTPLENIRHSIAMGFHVASDPKRMPKYKDGRSMGNKKPAYKAAWARARYHEEKKAIATFAWAMFKNNQHKAA